MNSLEIYKDILLSLGKKYKSITDVACGKGDYSIIAKRMKYDVFANDGRIDRVPI